MLKPVSTNTLIFDGENEKFELFEDLSHNAQDATRDDRSHEN